MPLNGREDRSANQRPVDLIGKSLNSCPDSNLRKTNFSSEKFLSLITEWIHSEYSKYSLHPGPRSQEEAVALCSSIGKQLVEPRSVDTNAEIIALAQLEMMSRGYGVWIGIDDKSEEGSFKYASDGSSVLYTNWNSDQPNNYMDQDCVLLLAAKDFEWGDEDCYSVQASFICEEKHGIYFKFIRFNILS